MSSLGSVRWVPEASVCNDSLLYFRKFHGYSSLKEYYEEESCQHYLHRVSSCSRDCSCAFIFLLERKCSMISVVDTYTQLSKLGFSEINRYSILNYRIES